MNKTSKKLDLRTLFMNYSVYIVLIVLLGYFSIANGDFLSTYNIENFLQQVPPVGILTVAYTMILICYWFVVLQADWLENDNELGVESTA